MLLYIGRDVIGLRCKIVAAVVAFPYVEVGEQKIFSLICRDIQLDPLWPEDSQYSVWHVCFGIIVHRTCLFTDCPILSLEIPAETSQSITVSTEDC